MNAPHSELERQLSELRERVAVLEDALRAHGMVTGAVPEQQVLQGTPAPPPAVVVHSVEPAPPAPLFAQQTASATPDRASLEARIGSQWFNRVGILAVLIGMAWFLKLAIDNHWIGPLGRVVIGLVAGAGAIAWSERFHRKGYKIFAYSLKAVGSGILYLSLWAAFSLFHLLPSGVAFAAMIAVTAFNGYMSWLQEAELLALYSIVGGFSTPLLLSTGENHEIALFSYLLLLDLAVLLLVMLRPWSRLLVGAFTGTVLFYVTWWFTYYTAGQFAVTMFFLSCFFVLFALAPRLVRLRSTAAESRLRWDNLTTFLMPVANAALGFLAFYSLFYWDIRPASESWAGALLAVVFAAFYLLLLRLPARAFLLPNSQISADLYLTTVVVFLVLAIPLKAHGRWLTIGWLTEGAALLWAAQRTRLALLRSLALLCLGLGLAVLVFVSPSAALRPVLNQRFATFCLALAIFAFVVRLAKVSVSAEMEDSTVSWSAIAAGATLVINGLVLLAVGHEIHSY